MYIDDDSMMVAFKCDRNNLYKHGNEWKVIEDEGEYKNCHKSSLDILALCKKVSGSVFLFIEFSFYTTFMLLFLWGTIICQKFNAKIHTKFYFFYNFSLKFNRFFNFIVFLCLHTLLL